MKSALHNGLQALGKRLVPSPRQELAAFTTVELQWLTRRARAAMARQAETKSRKWMQRSLLKRVQRLERDPRFQPPPPLSAAHRLFVRKFWRKANQLMREMDARYARLVAADLRRNARDPEHCSGIMFEFLNRVREHVREGRPLAFPAAVAEAYMENPHAGNGVECQQCRYKLPWGHFKLCPLCGGQVSS